MNPLAKLIGTAQTVARVPLHLAETVVGKAVKTVSGGREAADPAPERTRQEPPTEPSPAEPPESIEELARRAVAREMAEEPLDTPQKPTPKPKPAKKRAPEPDEDKPLIDSGTANAVRSEAEIMQAAADVDKKG